MAPQMNLPLVEAPSEARSRNMAAIKSKNSKPELLVRQELHAAGFRFRLHRKDLPGNPDIVLPRYHTAIQVFGCYWHGHGCKVDHTPRTNASYWSTKIAGNKARDARSLALLEEAGWNVVIVWECSLSEQTAALIDRLRTLRCKSMNDLMI